MAKYRRYRRYRRRTGRWSSNIQDIPSTVLTGVSGNWSGTTTLATNPAQTTTGVSQIFTVKNFEVNFVIESSNEQSLQSIENLCCYIMFVPQGMNVSENYNVSHPEYIMNYKFIGSPSPDASQNYQPFKIRTRLARKLNTGDSVVLFIKGYNQSTTDLTMTLSGLVRWWTKAN